MAIEETRLKEFIKIYRKEYGVELTISEAEEKATKLFTLYKWVYFGRE